MKLSKIAAIIKREKRIVTVHVAGVQWIGTGSCFYPISDMPDLDKNALFTMFDIPTGKREDFSVTEDPSLPGIVFDDLAEVRECLVQRAGTEMFLGGRVLSILSTTQGIEFINSRYLVPFTDQENGFELYERYDERGRIYFAVKTGFLTIGIIWPVKVDLDDFKKALKTWISLCELKQINERDRQIQEMRQMGLFAPEEGDGNDEED